MNKTTAVFDGQNSAPGTACVFACPAEAVRFVEDSQDRRFRIDAYDGGVIPNHWYWGNLAFDLSGLTLAASQTPVLDTHDTRSRIGVAPDGQITERGVQFEGRFLKNAKAEEIRSDMKDGFPMQASLSLDPLTVEQVADGATASVNGHRLKGPGAVFREAKVLEVSMCVLGAAPNTKSVALTDDNTHVTISLSPTKETTMAKDEKAKILTIDEFKAEHAELYDTIRTAGSDAEKARFTELQEACGEDRDLLVEAFADGWDKMRALTERNARLQAALSVRKSSESEKPAPKPEPDAATQEFIEQPPPAEGGEDKAFDEATASDEQLKSHFEATPDLRTEFSDEAEAYVAFVRAEREGKVRIRH